MKMKNLAWVRSTFCGRKGKMTCLWAVLLAVSILLCGCSGNQLGRTRPIEDVHHLDGQRVGVLLAWGPDYLLTGREDLNLIRYNTCASMVTALVYQRVDAIAVDKPMAQNILSSVSGLKMLSEPIAADGLVALVATDREDILEKFNAFIPEFQKTSDYEDLLARYDDEEGYQYHQVPVQGGGERLKVGVASDSYPYTYINFETGEYEGSDIEVIRHFANAYGYDIEIVDGTYESMEMGIYYGTLDIAVSGSSDLYRGDFEMTDSALVSDIYMPSNIVFIEIEDPSNLRVIQTIDY